jgi:hypothetical protein
MLYQAQPEEGMRLSRLSGCAVRGSMLDADPEDVMGRHEVQQLGGAHWACI